MGWPPFPCRRQMNQTLAGLSWSWILVLRKIFNQSLLSSPSLYAGGRSIWIIGDAKVKIEFGNISTGETTQILSLPNTRDL